MFEILQWLGGTYAFYRASQDAGMWWTQVNSKIFENYSESFMISKGLL